MSADNEKNLQAICSQLNQYFDEYWGGTADGLRRDHMAKMTGEIVLSLDHFPLIIRILESQMFENRIKPHAAEIEQLIEDEEYELAQDKIDEMRQLFDEFPQLVGLQSHLDMIQFLATAEGQPDQDVEINHHVPNHL